MKLFPTRTRIVRTEKGYRLEKLRWWFPIWLRHGSGYWPTAASAESYAKNCYQVREVVKEVEPPAPDTLSSQARFALWMRKEHPAETLIYKEGRYTSQTVQLLWEAWEASQLDGLTPLHLERP